MMGKHNQTGEPGGPLLEALAGAAVVGTVGYFAAEGVMASTAHPLHWVAAVAVGFIGYWVGEGVYRWKQR